MTLAEAAANVGKDVIYAPYAPELDVPERGVITSVNHRFAFVRYGSDLNAKATSPELLTLAEQVSR
jgi:hypothetical protein